MRLVIKSKFNFPIHYNMRKMFHVKHTALGIITGSKKMSGCFQKYRSHYLYLLQALSCLDVINSKSILGKGCTSIYVKNINIYISNVSHGWNTFGWRLSIVTIYR